MARKAGPEGDYYGGGEGWLKAILVFVGGIALVVVCTVVLWRSVL